MMTALDFLKQKSRICNAYPDCRDCPINNKNWYDDVGLEFCKKYLSDYPEEAIKIVEQWAAEHPARTRQSEFLKMFPHASLDSEGSVDICPKVTDSAISSCDGGASGGCSQCRQAYWLSEVE